MSVQQPNVNSPSHGHPPLYPTKPEATAAGSVYRTAVTSNPSLVPIQGSQFQPQYVSYAPVQHPSQSIAAVTSGGNYGIGATEQVYYTQVQAAPSGLPPQHQTMTAATAVALADASKF